MLYKRLSDYAGKGAYLMFGLPLYHKVKIEKSTEVTQEQEALDFDEEGIPGTILKHIHFWENTDVRYLKLIATEEKNFYHYCPFCKRETQITGKATKLQSELQSNSIDTYTTNHITEEIEYYEDNARKVANTRYKELKEEILDETGTLKIKFECAAKEKHQFYTVFQMIDDRYIMKTGQYPSALVFDNSLKEYRKILKDKEIINELINAEKLKTQDMGVGAFLYLRRIYEQLIVKKFEYAKSNQIISEQEVQDTNKFVEKVKLLYNKNLLQEYAGTTAAFIYPILSKGVHELKEKECNEYYPALRESILLILEEEVQAERLKKHHTSSKKTLNNIHSEIPKYC